jgi:RHH-type rel operon transcriptional repressor/antitoxin RelB
MLAIRLPEEIEKRLDALARRTGRTKTFYARAAIVKHIDDLEKDFGGRHGRTRVKAGAPASSSFAARWQGKFRPAERDEERYRALAKKYL